MCEEIKVTHARGFVWFACVGEPKIVVGNNLMYKGEVEQCQN
jgi:hypothetical protein